jgi:hypothetical protein
MLDFTLARSQTMYVLSILANKMLIGPTKHFRKKPEQEFAQGLSQSQKFT